MKWVTEYWGIIITTETDEDKRLLEALFNALPDEPESTYEDGNKELIEDNNGQLVLTLER